MADALTDKQERFAQEYLIDLNAKRAAVAAGYRDGDQGYALLQLDNVKARIDELKAERAERLQVKADWIVQQLREVVNRCMELEPVTEKGQMVLDVGIDGEVRAVVKFNAAGATKALELLGKHVGMFVERVEHSGEVNHRDLSENEIARRVAFILQRAVKQSKASTSPQQQQISNRSLQ